MMDGIETALTRFSSHARLAKALEVGLSVDCLDDIVADIDRDLLSSEQTSVAAFADCCGDYLALHTDVIECDATLQSMENDLVALQEKFSSLGAEVYQIFTWSESLKRKANNREKVKELISEYASRIVVTPDLVKTICTAPIGDEFLDQMANLTSKLEAAQSPDFRDLPSATDSVPELLKLKFRAIGRIRDFLSEKTEALSRPKTNIQILQKSVLLRYKPLYAYLAQLHPQSAFEVRRQYAYIMARVYVSQFKNYTLALENFVVAATPTHTDLLSSAVDGGGSLLGSLLGNNKIPPNPARTGLFSLNSRDSVLAALSQDPLIPAKLSSNRNSNLFFEESFRSFQRLLVDTTSAEFVFVSEFFCDSPAVPSQPMTSAEEAAAQAVGLPTSPKPSASPQALFGDIFGRTISFFVELMESTIESSWDAIGLFLMSRICCHSRLVLLRRGLPCLDAYINRVDELLLARVRLVLEANGRSVQKANVVDLGDSSTAHPTHPNWVVRRCVELLAAFAAIAGAPLGSEVGQDDDEVTPVINQIIVLQGITESLIKRMAAELPSDDSRSHFLINNFDLSQSILGEALVKHNVKNPVTASIQGMHTRFSKLLSSQIGIYVERLVWMVLPLEFIDVVRRGEAGQIVDGHKLEQKTRAFHLEWRKSVDDLNRTITRSFTNLDCGMIVLKQALTQLLLYYTRFQRVVRAAFPPPPAPQPEWLCDFVPNATILAEIRKYSK